jgi:CRISPR-associated protein Cas1
MLKGRLGLESARIPHADRHGLLWLGRGQLYVEAGTLRFRTVGGGDLERGDYGLPFQMVSCLVLQPGTSVSHDALRLLARHGTALVCVGEDGVRFYASLPAGPDTSARARRQVEIWSDGGRRIRAVRKLYAWRLGEVLPATDLDALRGIEGARMKETYRQLAAQFGIDWQGRRYDRSAPGEADVANQAINHAASAVEGAALTAVAATGTLPQLGFIHEDSGNAFALDVADLFRDAVLLPVAFGATRKVLRDKQGPVERVVRQLAGETFRREKVVSRMIDRIKELFDADDDRGNA